MRAEKEDEEDEGRRTKFIPLKDVHSLYGVAAGTVFSTELIAIIK